VKRGLGHLARVRVCRNSGLLRPVLLVHLPGLGAGHRPDLDEQQPGCQAKAKQLLDQGEIFAFGLSEKEHGADIYSSDMIVTKLPDGTYTAPAASTTSATPTRRPWCPPSARWPIRGEYIFFVADSQHPNYKLIKNTVYSQNFVAEYRLDDYPFTEADVLHHGDDAWNAALNTINVGKYNLGWASIGMCTHAFYEAIDHAANRHLYGKTVTDFPHVKQLFTDAYTRLVSMKLFALRAADYMKTASAKTAATCCSTPW
jgi:acyl-CoA dehydrogenase